MYEMCVHRNFMNKDANIKQRKCNKQIERSVKSLSFDKGAANKMF